MRCYLLIMSNQQPLSPLRQMLKDRDELGRSELIEEFDRSRVDDPSISQENLHLKDSYLGQKEQGDSERPDTNSETNRGSGMVEREQPQPAPRPPEHIARPAERETFAQRMLQERDQAAQAREAEPDREQEQDRERDR